MVPNFRTEVPNPFLDSEQPTKAATWVDVLTDRELREIEFCRTYAQRYLHGTDGHNRMVVVAKLADLLGVPQQEDLHGQ